MYTNKKEWQEVISHHPFSNYIKVQTALHFMEVSFKYSHSLQQFLECRLVTEYHRGTHTLVVLLPYSLYLRAENLYWKRSHPQNHLFHKKEKFFAITFRFLRLF